jgi:hypothetical protein
MTNSVVLHTLISLLFVHVMLLIMFGLAISRMGPNVILFLIMFYIRFGIVFDIALTHLSVLYFMYTISSIRCITVLLYTWSFLH